MIWAYPRKLCIDHPEIYEFRQSSLFLEWITYLIDSKKRRAAELSSWIKEQCTLTAKLTPIVSRIPTGKDYDETMLNVFKWVYNNFNYQGDSIRWKAEEYWCSAEESLTDLKGDCEDGAILIYILARLKGIPANRMLIWAGNVKKNETAPYGGHACLFYSPLGFPMNWVAMDWCYYPNTNRIQDRDLLTFIDKEIEIAEFNGKDWVSVFTPYQITWFMFNEEFSCSKYNLKRNL